MPPFSNAELEQLYRYLDSEQGVRRADVAQFLMKLRPGLKKEEATQQAGSILSTMHTAGFAIRNNLYYALTELGRKQIDVLKETK